MQTSASPQGSDAARTPVTLRRLATHGRAKLLFFVAAGLSFALSVSLWFGGSREQGLFVGLWVPSILSAGALLLAGEDDARE